MKRLGMLVAVLFLMIGAASVAQAESCRCSADDGSCSAQATCPGGCLAYCPGGGSCTTTCIRQCGCSGYEMLAESARERDEYRYQLVLSNASAEEVTAALSGLSNQQVTFLPTLRSATFNFDVHGATLLDVYAQVAPYGRLEVGGRDVVSMIETRKAIVSGQRMPFSVHGAQLRDLLFELTEITGVPLQMSGGDSSVVVDASYDSVSFGELLAHLSRQTGATIRPAHRIPLQRGEP